MTRCKQHQKFNCVVCEPNVSAQDRARRGTRGASPGVNVGAGEIGINTEGHLTTGLGSGLTLDLQDGSVGVRTSPGFSIDTPSIPSPEPTPSSYDSGSSSGSSYDSGSSSSYSDSGSY